MSHAKIFSLVIFYLCFCFYLSALNRHLIYDVVFVRGCPSSCYVSVLFYLASASGVLSPDL